MTSSPAGRMPARLVALVVAVVVVLAGNAAALVLFDDDVEQAGTRLDTDPTLPDDSVPEPPDAVATTTTTVPPPTSTQPPTPLERRVAELSAFVADERELEFLRPVDVELLADEAFVDRLLVDVEENREETDQSERVLRALHLIEPGVDLFEAFISFYGDAVLGFYDPETDELVVRGAELNPYVETTLVHELAHALDDQHFELHRPEVNDAEDESSLAFSSLVEGVALSVEFGYRQTLSADELEASARAAAEFARRAGTSPVPPVVTSLVQFPYLAGPFFVGALLEEGAEERVDAAFRDPPTTSEEIQDPSVYLRGEDPLTVPAPPAEGPVIDEGTFGQWALTLTLQELLDVETAAVAANGWGGDSYVAWDEDGRTCVRIAFAMDTPSDLAELEDAWRQWAEVHGDATVQSSSELVTVTACG
ncbi:MAG TPA: hypothetical protein VGR26_18165 [Acidimicrobiales bacterium]|nr:hypothetical protein [Acidimicrobiales bacterium]